MSQHPPEAPDDEFTELDAALSLLDAAIDGDDPDSPAASSGTAGENRAIHRARATIVRQESAEVSHDLERARARVRAAVEQARGSRRSASASRAEQARRRAALRDGRGEPASPLTAVLDRAARGLLERGEESLEHTLRLIVDGAIFALADATHAGVSLLEWGGITSHAPSDAAVAELDALQSRHGEGPCYDAVFDGAPVCTRDLDADGARWPRFTALARRHGVASVLSLQLFGRDDGVAGALNVYSDRAGAFDETAIEAGTLFASHAALALHGARRTAQLNDALRSRDVIGQAKGILVERFGLTEDRAFAMLVSSSQDTNMKLRAVAEWVVEETVRKHG